MDKQRKHLGWIDKLVIKNGSLFITALTILIPLYTRFVQTELEMKKLRESVDKLNIAITVLSRELQSEKTNGIVLTMRVQQLEQQTTKPGLFK